MKKLHLFVASVFWVCMMTGCTVVSTAMNWVEIKNPTMWSMIIAVGLLVLSLYKLRRYLDRLEEQK